MILVNRLVLALLAATASVSRLGAQQASWMFGPFEKPTAVNPIITPSAASVFRSPMGDSIVHWEQLATFNPAAVVRDGKVYVLYRAEDASGREEIGFHTSRIGLAESRGDYSAAIGLARAARGLAPRSPWVAHRLYELEARTGEFTEGSSLTPYLATPALMASLARWGETKGAKSVHFVAARSLASAHSPSNGGSQPRRG